MKNLPANMIEKVKAYDKKSDMARITGIDDGEGGGCFRFNSEEGDEEGMDRKFDCRLWNRRAI